MTNFIQVCTLLSIGAIASVVTVFIMLGSIIAILSASKEFERIIEELDDR